MQLMQQMGRKFHFKYMDSEYLALNDLWLAASLLAAGNKMSGGVESVPGSDRKRFLFDNTAKLGADVELYRSGELYVKAKEIKNAMNDLRSWLFDEVS
jgi:hypothetical protein